MTGNSEDISEPARRAARDVWVVTSRVRRRLIALEGEGEGDLTSAQASVLMRLDKQGPASASDLAVTERVRPQSIAKIVATLEQGGLVERHPDPDDGRRQLITLTELGRKQRSGDRRARETWLARALQEQATPEQLEAVIAAMAVLDDVAQS
ncbi:MarR family winged helix-turn-helix transcriptional regulator [Streptomyces sp. NPDC090052]|uniref:MarR family winged helix-turn-helix transcriptional regulator n=1 Tax=unclassified Streptomyces TaxID=2593676 RepID=UPI0022583912|nr:MULTISPECIES: MarR family transcriptional regulator [unclassified Streptomyces]MCX4725591.1 MarR family transcriptional regulator [Streptomyces sp. NBC_01306]WSV05048.1 MarR family transcriptional regulator [Streptomyces sp. NBC_01020]WSX43107.1 MarR family transcriptional regulator [Streptomyces sp. NBC_00963]WSX68876.1 MarR family transcriptional regulator [Streptomyces sp. NBC_00932]